VWRVHRSAHPARTRGSRHEAPEGAITLTSPTTGAWGPVPPAVGGGPTTPTCRRAWSSRTGVRPDRRYLRHRPARAPRGGGHRGARSLDQADQQDLEVPLAHHASAAAPNLRSWPTFPSPGVPCAWWPTRHLVCDEEAIPAGWAARRQLAPHHKRSSREARSHHPRAMSRTRPPSPPPHDCCQSCCRGACRLTRTRGSWMEPPPSRRCSVDESGSPHRRCRR